MHYSLNRFDPINCTLRLFNIGRRAAKGVDRVQERRYRQSFRDICLLREERCNVGYLLDRGINAHEDPPRINAPKFFEDCKFTAQRRKHRINGLFVETPDVCDCVLYG